MRRSSPPALACCLAALCVGLDVGASHAAPFDVFFAEPTPPHATRAARRRIGASASRSRPIRQARAPEQDAPVPLPVPRPTFPGEPAKPTATAPAAVASPPPARSKELGAPAPPRTPATAQTSAGAIVAAPTPASKPSAPAKPATAASGATLAETPRPPPDDPSCPARLKARNVAAEPIAIGPQPDARCTVAEAVRLTGLSLLDGGTVDFPDKPIIACATADTFSLYVRDLLVPLGKGTFSSPIASVWTGPGLECRSRDHIFGAKLSAHGQGLAIDIAQVKLADGRMIAVGEPRTPSEMGFETAARAGACGYFHTVLGPGSDSYHRTHWHFDLEVRGAQGDSKYCK